MKGAKVNKNILTKDLFAEEGDEVIRMYSSKTCLKQ